MRRVLALVAVAAVAGAVAGCSTTVQGRAVAVGQSGPGNERFAKLLEECAVVSPDEMARVVEADFVDDTFFGAICRYAAYRSSSVVDITLAWFETGSLYRERATAERLGYSVSNTEVAGQTAILIKVPGADNACGVATRASDAGVIQWWVQLPPGGGGDPCEPATALAELAVRASF